MENKPGIATAIPKRRYRLAEFTITVLGEIESTDGVNYRYIAAVVREQEPEPGLYVTAEQDDSGQGGALAMRIIMHDGTELIESSGRWNSLDEFVDEAISIISRVLGLADETSWQLM
jgi:signal recognition particle GTPase